MIRYILFFFLTACASVRQPQWPRSSQLTGTAYYEGAASFGWEKRDSFSRVAILEGNMPEFLRHFKPIHVMHFDSASGKKNRLTYWVAPDYLSVGTQSDWVRIHVTGRLANELADRLECFLPTRKMVDQIYKQAKIKLAPVPMYAFRDGTPTFWQHHLIIEGQRKGREGLIAGIKKDLVQTGRLNEPGNKDRVAIYGWHRLDGSPIQKLYTGHIWWYVDYSQAVRLVYQRMRVNGKWVHYKEVFRNESLRKLICDEEDCGL